ncbi:MAG: two-component regulator propeller domain-containing protein [Pedobacter sp.]|nr:two-component regulator propeller domain-containing protein [Pedobacter sp.]
MRTILDRYAIFSLRKDRQGVIWGITGKKLFKLVNEKLSFVDVDGQYITHISIGRDGKLYLVAPEKGIYKQTENGWIFTISFPKPLVESYIFKILFDRFDNRKMYVATVNNGVFSYDGKTFKTFFRKKNTKYHAIEQDGQGNIWIGLENGAVQVKKDEILYFNGSNGLSDNAVHQIFKDAENTIWISSFTSGIFKYEGDAFVRYNKFRNLNLAYNVSGIASDQYKNLYVGTFTKGLFKYDGKQVEILRNPAFTNKNIYFVYADTHHDIWFSVHDSGIWKIDGKNFKLVYKTDKFNYNSMVEGHDKDVWLATPLSLIHIKDRKKQEIQGFPGYASCLYPLSKDRLLVGTSAGLFLIKDGRLDRKFVIEALNGAYVLSIVKRNDQLIIGTLGDGMVTWDLKTRAVKKYTIVDGLNSNDVYGLTFDDKGNLWVGTGRGINTFTYSGQIRAYQVLKINSPIIECNQNAILNYDNNILVGTINGLLLCRTNVVEETHKNLLIHINKVNIYHKTDHDEDLTIAQPEDQNSNFELSHNQNNISINYKAVFLSNPQSVSYRYKLTGLDVEYGKSIKNTQVEYYSLRPGKYTFSVYAIANGQRSNVSYFHFTIIPPFYETIWFRVLAIVLVLFLIWLIFYLVFKSKESKKIALEKIKHTEQNKIRKQTAEDFHDDIGNKLTRINVLSEILSKKLNQEQTEQRELVRLIQENAGLLYNGTKDILWALNPKSDNLFEILAHIKNFGIDLFQNTGIKFEMEGILPEFQTVQLSMEFNRNFTLIFKEVLNNVLKHAKATEVLVLIMETPQHTIDILTIDNGIGFDMTTAERGLGLNNIQNRCKRIKSTFKINSTIGKGTTSIVSTKIAVTN